MGENELEVLSDTYGDIQKALVPHAKAFAEYVLGKPNAERSTDQVLYFGTKNNELAVTIAGDAQGTWHNVEMGEEDKPIIFLLQEARGLDIVETLKESAAWLESVNALELSPSDRVFNFSIRFTDAEKEEIQYVKEIFKESSVCEGTLAERYLKEHCGIPNTRVQDFVFHPSVYEPETQQHYPALIAVATNRKHDVQAMQCIYLNPETANILDITTPKRIYGPLRGAAVLVQEGTGSEVALVNAPETALSVAQEKSMTVYAVLDPSNFAHAPLRTFYKSVVLCADNYRYNGYGKTIVNAIQVLPARGVAVQYLQPHSVGDNYNDVLKKKGVNAIKGLIQEAVLIKPALQLESLTSNQPSEVYEALWPILEFKKALLEYGEIKSNSPNKTLHRVSGCYQKAAALGQLIEKEPFLIETLKRQQTHTMLTRFMREHQENARLDAEAKKYLKQLNTHDPVADFVRDASKLDTLSPPWLTSSQERKEAWRALDKRVKQLAFIIDRDPKLTQQAMDKGITGEVRNNSQKYQRSMDFERARGSERGIE